MQRSTRATTTGAREALAAGELPLPLNDIARRAGVGVGTVYRHFATDRILLETLLLEQVHALLEIARAAEAEDDPWRGIERVLRSAVEIELSTTGLGDVLAAGDDAQEQTSALKVELDSAVDRLLQRARSAKVIRRDVEADDIRRLVCGVGYAARMADHDQQAVAEQYLQVLLDGLRQRAAPR